MKKSLDQIKRSFNSTIKVLWKKPRSDAFYAQSYAWGWVEDALALQEKALRREFEEREKAIIKKFGDKAK